MTISATSGLLSCAAVLFLTVPRANARVESPLPAEEIRLPQNEFREQLKRRGLTEILEQHVREYPPSGSTAGLLLLREVKLAAAADPTRSTDAKASALAEANRLLEQLIQQEPADPRRLGWRFALAHSLLYQEAEPWISAILYMGGSDQDRMKLRPFTTRALAVASTLPEDLEAEYARLDSLPVAEFDALERNGYVQELDQLGPRAEYLAPWVFFYDALTFPESDAVAVRPLSKVLELVAGQPSLLTTAHAISGVQLQSLLLMGMVQRRLHNFTSAREFLERAAAVTDRIDDPAERQRVAWAVRLVWIERTRMDRNEERFDDAATAIAKLRSLLPTDGKDALGLQIVTGLLERSVYRARAAAAEQAGRGVSAARFREEAWLGLSRLAAVDTDHRRELYATLYHLIGPQGGDPLDPVETCAWLAGLLSDAEKSPDGADAALQKAVETGTRFVAHAQGAAAGLVAEVLFNTGVAEYRRGRNAEAARCFVAVTRDHVLFPQAPAAATLGVQIAADLYERASIPSRSTAAQLYREALEALLTSFSTSEAARNYRFYYAQLLADAEEHDKAAVQFALVSPNHVHHLESMFLRLRCLSRAMTALLADEGADPVEVRRRLNEFLNLHRGFVSEATEAQDRMTDPESRIRPIHLLAASRLMLAEVLVLRGVDRPNQALETLDSWESSAEQETALLGRVWRVRIVAFEKLGRTDDAARSIPKFLAADPKGAAPTLHSLFRSLSAESEALRAANDETAANKKAESALAVAEQVEGWVATQGDVLDTSDRIALRCQLAEANLLAGRYARARDLFRELLGAAQRSGSPADEPLGDPRVTYGYAEAQYQLGEYKTALEQFNPLATGMPPAEPLRWKSLLRDLQCRTLLNHPPAGIIKVIQQQKHLYPDLGGPALSPQFQQLLRDNERRAADGNP